jgi:hypothetical protein
MERAPLEQPVATVQLDHILQSAIIQAWKDLGQPAGEGRVQLEYHAGRDNSIEYLKMWCANHRGYWSLVCDYSVNPGWSGGPRFANGYHSRELGRSLEAIMMNQTMFCRESRPESNVLLQVGPPSAETVAEAVQQLAEVFAKATNPLTKVRRPGARVPVAMASPATL